MSSKSRRGRHPTITEATARAIAEDDARKAYRDLSIYTVAAHLEDDHWNVDYDLQDVTLLGGGPHYVIDAETGEIVSLRYEQ
jgi:hypothetical protein